MEQALRPKLTIRLYTDEKCFGPGVASLLQRVEEHHSLRAAAQSMDMAYSKAWKIIRQAEKGLDCKLLESTTGGKGGGGAVLTEAAKQILTAYLDYCSEVETYSEKLFQEHFDFLNH